MTGHVRSPGCPSCFREPHLFELCSDSPRTTGISSFSPTSREPSPIGPFRVCYVAQSFSVGAAFLCLYLTFKGLMQFVRLRGAGARGRGGEGGGGIYQVPH